MTSFSNLVEIKDDPSCKIRIIIIPKEIVIKSIFEETPVKTKKLSISDKLRNLKIIYAPVKFINYQFNPDEEYLISPDFIEMIIRKIFSEEKYKNLIKEARVMAEKHKLSQTYNINR